MMHFIIALAMLLFATWAYIKYPRHDCDDHNEGCDADYD